MTVLNPTNPRIAAAQAQVNETLAGIPDEYGAVFVIDDYQLMQTGLLPVAVREERKRLATEQAARLMGWTRICQSEERYFDRDWETHWNDAKGLVLKRTAAGEVGDALGVGEPSRPQLKAVA